MRLFGFIVLFSASQVLLAIRIFEDEPNPGYRCDSKLGIAPSIKYYLDRSRWTKYPFLYLGCGGDSNRYNNSETNIVDYHPCPGFGYGPSCNSEPNKMDEACPIGYKCQYSYPVSKCCSIADAEKYNDNIKAYCPRISPKVELDPEQLALGKEKPFFGRNCSHNFCHKDSTCFQGPFLAFCCHK